MADVRIFTRPTAGGWQVVDLVDDIVKAYSFQGRGDLLTLVDAVTLDSLDSLQFLRSDVADTVGAALTYQGFDGSKLIVKATAADETAGDVKLVDVQTSAGVSKFSVDEDGDVIANDLLVNGVMSVVQGSTMQDSLTITGALIANGAVTLGDGADLVAVNAGTQAFTIDSSNLDLSSDGELITSSVGTVATRIPNGYFDNIDVTNLSAAGTEISGTKAAAFTINSDNDTADGEDASLAFERGTTTPNATITWDASADEFVFNYGISVTGDVSGTTIGGITEANLLDKTAAETISGTYTFSAELTLANNVYVSGGIIGGAGTTLTLGSNDANNNSATIYGDLTVGSATQVKVITLNGTALTATATEINQALDGISANVTYTNLNTLTAGSTSVADALHTHSEIKGAVYVASAVITAGAPLYIAALGGVKPADATDSTQGDIAGFANAAAALGANVNLMDGGVAEDVLTGATPGAKYYLAVGGGYATTPAQGSGQTDVRCGRAKSATALQWDKGEAVIW